MSLARASTPALAGLALLSMTLYAAAEKSLTPVHARAYERKLQAVAIMRRAEAAIVAGKQGLGIPIDAQNDPDRSGVIGPQFSLITTDRGDQEAKQLAAHPNFAAAVTQMLLEAGVRKGDVVAIGMTGSLPGLNLAVLSACSAIGADPIAMVSVGASMFGATDPSYTWLDMEATLRAGGILPYRSVAASPGGGGDVGRGLSPQGRDMLDRAIARNDVRGLASPTVLEAVKERVAIYDSVAAASGRKVACYVNVGGGIASLGGRQNARLIPAGVTLRLAHRNYPNRGVINVYGERGLPVVQLLDVRRLARRYGILDRSGNSPPPGKGLVFVRFRYNVWLVAVATVVVLIANLFVLRLDIRHQMLGRPHPERTSA
jgi:poly-gamma-glutamate system protein